MVGHEHEEIVEQVREKMKSQEVEKCQKCGHFTHPSIPHPKDCETECTGRSEETRIGPESSPTELNDPRRRETNLPYLPELICLRKALRATPLSSGE